MRSTSSFSSKDLIDKILCLLLASFLTLSFTACYDTISRSALGLGLIKKAPKAPVFTPVNDWLYRGSEPEEDQLGAIQRKGVRTVINFRTNPKSIAVESRIVEGLGMNYVSLPWSVSRPADPRLLDQFFAVLDDFRNRPVYFHCKHGRDRSGVMATLALMRYERLSLEEARENALETIRPNLTQILNVDQRIAEFIRARPAYFKGR